jgi:integrase/recombinase XerD
MLQLYRRHNPAHCKKASRSDYRCDCPIWVQGQMNGERIRKALKERDWAKAQAQVRKWEVDGDRPAPVARATVGQWKDSFLQDATSRHLAHETIRKYKHLFKQLEAFSRKSGLVLVQDFTVAELTAFRASWKDKALSSAKKTERLRSLFKYAIERDWIKNNPAHRLKIAKPKETPTLPFTDDEMTRIIKAAEDDQRMLTFVYVMRYSGLRLSDTVTLRVTSLQSDKLHLYTAKTGTPVRVPLPRYVVKELKAVKHTHPDYFFFSGHAKVQSACGDWSRDLSALFTKAKVTDGHSHRFRDTFAVGLLQAGMSIENVSVLLGHTNIKITQKHYSPWVKLRQDLLEKEIYRINEIGTELD